jgi:hypothetical protein
METNYYLGSYIAPFVILLVNYFLRRKSNMKIIDYIKILIDVSIHLFGLAFLLFFLYYEKKIDTGWTPISILTLNIPFFIILIIAYLYFYYFEKKGRR